MKKKKNIIIGAATGILIFLIGVLAISVGFQRFDPKDYVKATLDQVIKGDVRAAAHLMSGTTEEALKKQYEEGIASFVKSSIINSAELDEALEGKYIALCKKTFESLKYSVQDAKKTENGGYEVTVSYQPVDVFINLIAAIGEESGRMDEKVQNGDYRGTLEEINQQMQKDFLNSEYQLFEECYNKMKSGEKETYSFTVSKDKEGIYGMDGSQISGFLTKILNLDEI